MDPEVGDCVSECPQDALTTKCKQEEDALINDHGNFLSVEESSLSGVLCKSSTSGSMNSNNPKSGTSDLSCQNDDDINDDVADEDPDYASDYYENDYFIYEDDYVSMQDQLDSVDLPPGVEASLPWFKDFHSSDREQNIDFLCAESSSMGKVEETEDTILQKFGQFKQFDTVDAYPDHHYDKVSSKQQRPKNWAKKIQEEWNILQENLPETIFVRVCETRMELLRAVIIGPPSTPYHDGLFFFDCFFPPTYPADPPMVHFHSGGLRLNPNLYACGKVCLSLLGTWYGENSCENWIPDKSTMLQVLVSIQALILNEKPFFNEPGYISTYIGLDGERRSKEYNENTFILTLKTMMYTLRKPPKHFEDLVAGHFRTRAYNILTICKSYVEGAQVGSVVNNLEQSSSSEGSSKSQTQTEFQASVSRMMNTLIAFFTRNGSTDSEEFRTPELYKLSATVTANLEMYKIETDATQEVGML